MGLVPELECRVKAQFTSLQDQKHLLQLGVMESAKRGYLVGDTLGRTLCEKKMADDVIKVVMELLSQKMTMTRLIIESTTFEKIGIIGKFILTGKIH